MVTFILKWEDLDSHGELLPIVAFGAKEVFLGLHHDETSNFIRVLKLDADWKDVSLKTLWNHSFELDI